MQHPGVKLGCLNQSVLLLLFDLSSVADIGRTWHLGTCLFCDLQAPHIL